MTLPISERVMSALLTQLQTISVANDYNTDAGINAVRSMMGSVIVKLPGLQLVETTEVVNTGSATDDNESMSVTLGVSVEAHGIADLEETPQWLGLARADVKRCLMGWAKGLIGDGGLGVRDESDQFGSLAYLGSDLVEQPDDAESAAITINFTVRYKEGYGDPYNAL